MNTKLPLIENVYRWIDIYSYFNYPDKVRDLAYFIVTNNQKKLGRPHVSAATSIMMACGSYSIEFDINQMDSITHTHLNEKTSRSGLWPESLKRTALKWTL
jgi:hypothetical protein